MISTIRNPWVRRPLVVLVCPFYWLVVLFISLLAAGETAVRELWQNRSPLYGELCDALRDAWRGPGK